MRRVDSQYDNDKPLVSDGNKITYRIMFFRSIDTFIVRIRSHNTIHISDEVGNGFAHHYALCTSHVHRGRVIIDNLQSLSREIEDLYTQSAAYDAIIWDTCYSSCKNDRLCQYK